MSTRPSVHGIWIALSIALCAASPAQALTCGQIVTGVVTLTADLICPNMNGLVVQTSNVTINLNGHVIRCVSATGYEGSCQAPNVGQAFGDVGILVSPKGWVPGGPVIDNIAIRGPGEIYGFEYGIQVDGGFEIAIDQVTISGPVDDNPPSLVNPGRSFAAGINLLSLQCNSDLPSKSSIVISSSDISNQTLGIWMSAVSCGVVRNNRVHDNTGSHKTFFVYGILLAGQGAPFGPTEKNLIEDNQVIRNGNNVYEGNWPGNWMENYPDFDAGIAVRGGTAIDNEILHNVVSENCGDGIMFHVHADNNTVAANTMLANSQLTFGGRCLAVPVGTSFDAAERWPGVVNNWIKNNTCHTQSPGVPANVCQ